MRLKGKIQKKFNPALISFILTAFLGTFFIGGLFGSKNWQPFAYFKKGYHDMKVLIREINQKRPLLLLPKFYQEKGVVSYNASKVSPGLTLLQGTMPGGTQLSLIDMDGKEVRRWPVDFFELWPNPQHLINESIPKTPFNYHTQGVELLEDGSVIFNIGDKGTAKLDKCGKLLWTIDRMTHHSVTRTDDGGFWIPAHRDISEIPEQYLFRGLSKESLRRGTKADKQHEYENLILRVNANGKVLREFSILKSLIDGGFESELYDTTKIKETDPTHVNDIEVVTQALADKLSNVSIGDILVSIRQAHMLVIMDQHTGEIKWRYRGRWVRQHDPDITAEGNIIVFNNGHEEFSFNRPKGSSLIMFDPNENTEKVIYPVEGMPPFYTDVLGEHQLLENGNNLITESRRGRVFEVTNKGEIVWDYILPYDKSHASLIAIARRFPPNYFNVTDWSCP